MEGICGFVTFPNKHKIIVANIYRPLNELIDLKRWTISLTILVIQNLNMFLLVISTVTYRKIQ